MTWRGRARQALLMAACTSMEPQKVLAWIQARLRKA
jgi:hypothetical protein